MIDLALNNAWLVVGALIIGIATGRLAFSSQKGAATPGIETKQEDDLPS